MAIDTTEIGEDLINRIIHLKEAGLQQVMYTCVYDGDELETCSVDAVPYDFNARTGYMLAGELDDTLIDLAKMHEQPNGSYILNLETCKLYRTAVAWRRMEIVEDKLRKPEETDLSGLDLRTQAEKDY
jgi:hypothetical protein